MMNPTQPNSDELISLLEKGHSNWTSKDIENAYQALQSLTFHWFRREVTEQNVIKKI